MKPMPDAPWIGSILLKIALVKELSKHAVVERFLDGPQVTALSITPAVRSSICPARVVLPTFSG